MRKQVQPSSSCERDQQPARRPSSPVSPQRPLPPWPVVSPAPYASPAPHDRRACPGAPVQQKKSRSRIFAFGERDDGEHEASPLRPRRLFFGDDGDGCGGQERSRPSDREATGEDVDCGDFFVRRFEASIESPRSNTGTLGSSLAPTSASTPSATSASPSRPTTTSRRIISPQRGSNRENTIDERNTNAEYALGQEPGTTLAGQGITGRSRSISNTSTNTSDARKRT